MNNQLATAMALALVVGVAGLSVAPIVGAVSPDCTDPDFYIDDTKETRPLDADEQELGQSNVTVLGGDEIMTVTLETADAQLEFGIFEAVNGCTRSSNVSSNCANDVLLDTDGKTEESIDCTLHADSVEDREFFVVFKNVGDVSLEYSTISD